MQIALVITAKCNAACDHCSTSCSPRRKEALSKEEVIRLMNEAAQIDDREPLEFHLTGGEPFINYPLLLEVVAHAKELRAEISCATNAYWARTSDAAIDKLAPLKKAGLTSIAISTSRFHEGYVPRRNVGFALAAARRLKLVTELKGTIVRSDLKRGGLLERWRREFDADEVSITPVIPYLREGATLPESEYYRKAGLPRTKCPDPIVCIEADGAAMSCCGQSPKSGFLALGNARQDPLSALYERFVTRGKQRILKRFGPIAFARKAIAAGFGDRLRKSYAGPCDLCLHIGTDPDLRKLADDLSALYETSPGSECRTWRNFSKSVVAKETAFTSIARRLKMSETDLEALKDILSKAATDSEFRAALMDSPRDTFREFTGREVGVEALEILISLTEDVRRIGGGAIAPQESDNWAIGLLVNSITRRRHLDWKVALESIPRRTSFGVNVEGIPRKKKKKSTVRVSSGRGVNLMGIPRKKSAKKKTTARRARSPK